MLMLHHGDCLDVLKTLPDASVDSLVTDPPAGILFMGKSWDGDRGGRDQWVAWMTEVMRECLRVLKPGAHGLVWALPRTSHWTATALEDAGFEVRDVVTHLFGTGFPKSLDVSKAIDKAAGAEREVVGLRPRPDGSNPRTNVVAGFTTNSMAGEGVSGTNDQPITAPATDSARQWQGWGTALKPASEHWILVRKPCSEKTVAANVLKWGTGAINVDGCRISTGGEVVWKMPADCKPTTDSVLIYKDKPDAGSDSMMKNKGGYEGTSLGRFPANLILDEEAAAALDEQSGERKVAPRGKPSAGGSNDGDKYGAGKTNGTTSYADRGGASRFFYVAKASKADKGADNTHPTVKSTALMRYLIRLVTPPAGTVLDPFAGSGSTLIAAKAEGMSYLGIERDESYHAIATKRLG